MARLGRNVRRLVGKQLEHVAPTRHARLAADHHPVLGAPTMKLKRQLRAGLQHQALDLEALARVDALVPAPGPVDAQMREMLAAAVLFQVLDRGLDVLRAGARGDERRISYNFV